MSRFRRENRLLSRRFVLGIAGTAGVAATAAGCGTRSIAQGAVRVSDFAAPGSGDASDAVDSALEALTLVTTQPDAYDGVTPRPRRTALVFGSGLWNLSRSVVIPQGVDVEIEADAYLKATAPMDAVLQTELDVVHQDGRIRCRGVVDCDGAAAAGVYVRSFAQFEIDGIRVHSPARAGVVLGDPASSRRPYAGVVRDPSIWRPNGQPVPEDSVGIRLQYVTDCQIGGSAGTIVGCRIGVHNEVGGNSSFTNLHCWGYPPNSYNGESVALIPATGFRDDATGSTYINCYADSPAQHGWLFTNDDPRAQLIGCRVYTPVESMAAGLSAVHMAGARGTVTVMGMHVEGPSAANPIGTDFSGDLGGGSRSGISTRFVRTTVGDGP